MGVVKTVMNYFVRGGWVMWPLLLCSLASLSIAIERFIFFKQADSGENFKKQFCILIENGKWIQAKQLADNTKGEAAKLATIVMDRHSNFERVEDFVAGRGQRAINKFSNYLSYLGAIVSLAPILGLLGTITGMIAAFNALNNRGDNPLMVTAGIGEALITTVFGLCIAIISICFHTYFSQNLERIILDVEEVGRTLLEGLAKKLDQEMENENHHA